MEWFKGLAGRVRQEPAGEEDEAEPATGAPVLEAATGVPVLESAQERRERWRSIYVIYFTMFQMSLGFSIVLTGVWPYLDKVSCTAHSSPRFEHNPSRCSTQRKCVRSPSP